ncbi:AAA family ATPase [Pseudarthrobacter sp. L19]|uniref:AAA family ATPase n=1 Tax=Pseudarthrobacter sp. L19 TaxID=3423951 RepID=UPI003D79B1ED
MDSSKTTSPEARDGRSIGVSGRAEDLRAAMDALRGSMHVAVLLVGEHGIGKSTLMEAVVAELGNEVTPIRLHGSPALSNVPYGVLGPYIVDLPVEEATSQLAVLRTFWSHLEAQRRITGQPLLLIVDDAHDLDEATAAVLVELAAAGWAKLVVSAAVRPGLPTPLLELWFEGIAERHDLRPLTLEQTQELLSDRLGPQVLPSAAEMLWHASAGNPLLLTCLIDDARNDGTLKQRNGVWLLTRALNSHGERLTDVVRRQLLRLSVDERTALNLVALSEPVSRKLIEAMVDEDTVAGLVEQELLRVTDAAEPELRLWHTTYGDTLRNLVSPARSLQLRQGLLRLMDREPASAEGLLRQVSWSLDCGMEVGDRQLLRAAALASALFEDELARRAAGQVKDPDLRMAGRAIIARTYYNTAHHATARDILEEDFGRGGSVTGLLSGTLLWAAVLTALGHKPDEIVRRSEELMVAGERLAGNHPGEADSIRAATAARVGSLRALARALAGEREDDGVEPPGDPIGDQAVSFPETGEALPDHHLESAFELALQAEQLLVRGKTEGAYQAATAGMEAAGQADEEVSFLTDFLAVRAATPLVHGGNWSAAESLLGGFSASYGASLIAFGGGVHTAAGIMLLYQGRAAEAKKTLRAGLEALRIADAQQLFALTAAMAFAAAAEVGAKSKAAGLLGDYESARPPASRYLRTLASMAVVYGKAKLEDHADPLGELRRLGSPRVPGVRDLNSSRWPGVWPSGTRTPRPGCGTSRRSWRAAARRLSALTPPPCAPGMLVSCWRRPKAVRKPSCGDLPRRPTVKRPRRTAMPVTPCANGLLPRSACGAVTGRPLARTRNRKPGKVPWTCSPGGNGTSWPGPSEA